MRKIVIMAMIAVLLLACGKEKESSDQIKLEKYAYIYQTISDNDAFTGTSSFYDLQIVMAKLSQTEYRYDIIVDHPRIAMYDIQIMAIENNTEYSMATKMMPSIGIFDDNKYNMVPYQVNVDLGYVEGLIISGITEGPMVNLKIRVAWKDYTEVVETTEYFNITVDYNTQSAK